MIKYQLDYSKCHLEDFEDMVDFIFTEWKLKRRPQQSPSEFIEEMNAEALRSEKPAIRHFTDIKTEERIMLVAYKY